jgi:hypothetical protein
MDINKLRRMLQRRRHSLRMPYAAIQRRTGLGYNTVRRTFANPDQVRLNSLLLVMASVGCTLTFSVEETTHEQNGARQ